MKLSSEVNKVQESQYLETIIPDQVDPDMVKKFPLEFLKKQCAIPILIGDEPAVALSNELNFEAFDAIVQVLGRPCVRVICPAGEIERAISRCYYNGNQQQEQETEIKTNVGAQSKNDINVSSVQTRAEDLLSIANKAPAIKLANKILFQALHSRASDIHIEPYENQAHIRFRIDGVMHNIADLSKEQVLPLISRLKVMANLNIAERRLPQDGQSRIKTGDMLVDIRVSVIPTSGGERIVLRLLDKGRGQLTLEEIGFGSENLKTFRKLINIPHGIILLTGPTGSGKTTTLYSALNELNSEERNILTVEDPVEYQLPGIGQMQIKPSINLTFANCLRHILRQDPDVIMIGEIRDTETARIAIQASLTGHLVLSTLHTNDSASAFTRLIEMGIEPYLISSTVAAVMAQRLVRVICPNCKKQCGNPDVTKSGEQELNFIHFTGLGCVECLQTGFLGRTGIFELLVVDDRIRELIVSHQPTHKIKQAAIENGLKTLRQDGIEKVKAQITTLEEVYRVTQDSDM